MAKKRAFVKYTKAGDIIPGSLVFTNGSYPKDGLYYEVATDLCCTTETIPTVRIGTQSWTTKNLDVTTYKNGDPIPQVTDPSLWESLTTGAWCYYNNDPALGAIYGKLYNGYAVNDPRGLAPVGYHVPTDAEWNTLTTLLGGDSVAGGPLKETGTSHWLSPNLGATNASGFTGLPGGILDSGFPPIYFNIINAYGVFWSSSIYGSYNGFAYLSATDVSVVRSVIPSTVGCSVRLIKD